jgi:hypothetical protein
MYGDFGTVVVSARTGKELFLNERPQFSPSRQRFVVVVPVGPNEPQYDVAIYRTSGSDLPELEWGFKHPVSPDGGDTYVFGSWNGESRIKLKGEMDGSVDAEVVHDGKVWRLQSGRPRL